MGSRGTLSASVPLLISSRSLEFGVFPAVSGLCLSPFPDTQCLWTLPLLLGTTFQVGGRICHPPPYPAPFPLPRSPLCICDVYAISNEPPQVSVQTKSLNHKRPPFTHLTVTEDEDDIMIFKANRKQYNTHIGEMIFLFFRYCV